MLRLFQIILLVIPLAGNAAKSRGSRAQRAPEFAAGEMKITKFSKAGSGEYYTGLYFKMPRKSTCIMELHSDLGAADPQNLDPSICKNVEKLIKRIKAPPRDLRFVRQSCPVSFEEIVLDSKARLYCIKGRKSDGKAVRHLNRYLSALSVKYLRVDF